jgi:hypothetical protein
MTALKPTLTLEAAPRSGRSCTAATVTRDRESEGTAGRACTGPPAECWYCGADVPEPFRMGGREFCCRACAADYGE